MKKKKKKSDDQAPAGFKNNPFGPLRGFAPQPPSSTKTGAFPRRKEQPAGDDNALFLRAVSGTRRIDRDEEAVKPPAKTLQTGGAEATEDRAVFLKAMQKIGSTLRAPRPEEEELLEEPKKHRSPTSRMRQLKRGSIRIGDELDLHGLLRDEALLKLEHFIAGARSRGLDAVLVITGKGVNSPEGPVLKGAVTGWFHGRGKGMVAEFSPAPRERGGSGAFVVFLKKT